MNEIKDTLQFDDMHPPPLPSLLNVLTILTFIGCALAAFSLSMNYFQDCDKALASLENLPELGGFFDKLMNMSKLSIAVMCENKWLILLSSAVGVALCVFGAMQMRQLKRQGLIIYLIGEFLAPIVVFILSLSIIPWLALTGFVIPIVMAILYATQNKYLVN